MKIIVVLLVGAMFAFSSCGSDSSIEQLRAVNKSLENSNALIADNTERIRGQISSESRDHTSGARRIVQSRADSIIKKSAGIVKFITSLKSGLGDLEKDKDMVHKIFEDDNKGIELYKMLSAYRGSVRNLFEEEEREIVDRIFELSSINQFESYSDERSKMWVTLNFQDAGVLPAKVFLSTLQNDILLTENRLIDHIHSSTAMIVEDWISYSAIVVLDKGQVRPGDEMEIYAGLGKFDTHRKPDIVFNGAKVTAAEDGVATYKFKARKEPGGHAVTVEIRFVDNNGGNRTITKEVRYNVVK